MGEYAYIGIMKCGCVVAATMDMPDHAKQVAKDVAGFIREGYRVERVSTEEVRVRLKACDCDKDDTAVTTENGQMELLEAE